MGIRRSGNPNDLAAEGLHQKAELRLRVQNKDIIVCRQGNADNFLLGGEGFAGTADAQTEAVSVKELAAVSHNHVFGNGVLPIIDAPGLHDLLCPEGNQHSGALGGEGSQRLNFSQTIRENRIQPVLLLPAENAHLAQVFPGCGEDSFGV